MATLVFLHAHPDDDASQTSGTMSLAVDRGDRVVCVYGTNGDFGMAADDLGDASVSDYRRGESLAAAKVIGTQRVAWLGYSDSGMTGWPQNDAPGAFMNADLDTAALRLAAILDEEHADFVIGYDWHGNYGHPDHVMVHKVAKRAAELADCRPVFIQSTQDRDEALKGYQAAIAAGVESFNPETDTDDGNPIGTPEADITWTVDVSSKIDVKRGALMAHASQTSDAGMMVAMPPEIFAAHFGHECYIDERVGGPMREGWPFEA